MKGRFPTLLTLLHGTVSVGKRLGSRLSPVRPRLIRLPGRLLRRMDPRVVRLRDPVPLIRRVLSWGVAASGLVITVALLTAGEGSASAKAGTASLARSEGRSNTHWDPIAEKPVEAGSVPEGAAGKPLARSESRLGMEGKHASRSPRFFDPLLVFTEQPLSSVRAYPLRDPVGIVVDIHGIPEPLLAWEKLVGPDERILGVKRRSTSGGVRYIIYLSTPVQKIETEYEGNVVMVYPVE